MLASASANCFMLLRQVLPRAVSRAFCTAGNKQRHQRSDNRDHNQQLDQRKAATNSCLIQSPSLDGELSPNASVHARPE